MTPCLTCQPPPPPPKPSISALSPAGGSSGTSITISGSNFGTTKGTVAFNGVSPSISSLDEGSSSTFEKYKDQGSFSRGTCKLPARGTQQRTYQMGICSLLAESQIPPLGKSWMKMGMCLVLPFFKTADRHTLLFF
jgi:IPT/TIG domain-containing protein